jgi:hypothetical protein
MVRLKVLFAFSMVGFKRKERKGIRTYIFLGEDSSVGRTEVIMLIRR